MTEPKPFTLKELDGVSVTSFIRVAANVIVAAGIFEFEVELPCKCVRRFYLSTHPRIDAARCTEPGDATPQPKDHYQWDSYPRSGSARRPSLTA
jgi:hypothetical protein